MLFFIVLLNYHYFGKVVQILPQFFICFIILKTKDVPKAQFWCPLLSIETNKLESSLNYESSSELSCFKIVICWNLSSHSYALILHICLNLSVIQMVRYQQYEHRPILTII